MFEFFKRRREKKRMDALLSQYLNDKFGTPVKEPSISDMNAAQMQDAWRFMVSQHPTVPTIDKGE